MLKTTVSTNRLFYEGLILLVLLVVAGTVNLYSALTGTSGLSPLFYKHLVWLLVAVILSLFIQIINLRILEGLSLGLYLFSLFLLLLVIFVGKKVYGAQRWLSLGFISFQPSELIKIAFILYFAKYFKDMPVVEGGYRFRQLVIPLIIVLIPFILILKQPDLGTGIILFLIAFFMLLILGIDKKIIYWGGALLVLFSPLLWRFLKDYQKKRIIFFLEPEKDPLGAGYQTIQSKIAISNGGFWGKGYLQGIQSKLGFIPEKHTDYVFTVFSEEWGLMGCFFYIILSAYFVFWMFRAVRNVKDRFLFLTASGIIFLYSTHFIINTAMVSGLFPVVGIPLPLFSYGGTALIVNLSALSLILRLSREY